MKSRLLLACALVASFGGSVWLFLMDRTDAPPAANRVERLENLIPPDLVPAQETLIRQELRDALGFTPGIDFHKRLDLLRSLSGAFSEDECRALLGALHQPRPAELSEAVRSEYTQEICLALRDQEVIRHDFARVLVTLARDQDRAFVIRDYALQHLRALWDRSDDSLRASVEDAFKDIVLKGDSLAASGLLSLHTLGIPAGNFSTSFRPIRAGSPGYEGLVRSSASEGGYHLADSELEPLVRETLQRQPDPGSMSLRMTAIRIVADRRMTSLKPELTTVVADPSQEHALVRMAAIAAIARFADPADKALLESLDRKDPRIARAISHALSASRQ